MKKLKLLGLVCVSGASIGVLAIQGCGRSSRSDSANSSSGNVGVANQDGVVVQSRAVFVVDTDPGATQSLTGTIPVTFSNSASSTMTLDVSKFKIPTITSDSLDFGLFALSALKDNNLSVCGTTGKLKCTTAMVRVYTTGTAGAGFYNAVGGYGAPMTAGLPSTPLLTVGLNVAGAAILQTMTIPASKNVLQLSDFTPVASYSLKGDFTNAGAGSYSTTIVVEYALSP